MNFMTKEKHYNTLNNYYFDKYKTKVCKISLNGGFSCPNKDNGSGGCTYCSEAGSGDFAGNPLKSITEQFKEIKDKLQSKWPKAAYIAYFQANTNTYGPLSKLKQLYQEAITADENIVSLAISTRPDCLSDEVIDYLSTLNTKLDVQVELGLQTIHQKTIDLINRGHNLSCFTDAVKRLRKKGIAVVVHIINGLPYETEDMMLDTIRYLNTLDIQGIKIHLLHIMKNTKMGIDFLKNPFPVMTLYSYVDIVTKQLRILKPNVIIHRLTGDAPKELLIEPKWSLKKFIVINEIDKQMRKLDAYQGDQYHSLNGHNS